MSAQEKYLYDGRRQLAPDTKQHVRLLTGRFLCNKSPKWVAAALVRQYVAKHAPRWFVAAVKREAAKVHRQQCRRHGSR